MRSVLVMGLLVISQKEYTWHGLKKFYQPDEISSIKTNISLLALYF